MCVQIYFSSMQAYNKNLLFEKFRGYCTSYQKLACFVLFLKKAEHQNFATGPISYTQNS